MNVHVTLPIGVGCRAALTLDPTDNEAAVEFYVAHTYIWSWIHRCDVFPGCTTCKYEAPEFQRAVARLVTEASRAHGCAYP